MDGALDLPFPGVWQPDLRELAAPLPLRDPAPVHQHRLLMVGQLERGEHQEARLLVPNLVVEQELSILVFSEQPHRRWSRDSRSSAGKRVI